MISYIYSQTPYVNRYRQSEEVSHPTVKSQEMRQLLRNLQGSGTQSADPCSMMAQSKNGSFLETYGVEEQEGYKEQVKNAFKYNYREVSLKIRQAKNSTSAGQAVISAKRKVLEVKRKIAKGDGDDEELQLALSHAKQMEMAARKKKHHLELEELVDAVRGREEHAGECEDGENDSASESELQSIFSEQAQEEVSKAEDAVLKMRQELLDSVQKQMKKDADQISDEMMADLNEMIAEFGEEELKELEEEMEQLECLEVVDPHMSEEQLEDLKRKHRNAENKAMTKADMDYLKGMFKHLQEKGSPVLGFSGINASAGMSSFSVTVDNFTSLSVPSVQMTSIDIQI